MRYTDHDIAYVCHEANRALQYIQGDPAPSPPWDQAPADQVKSAVQGVRDVAAGTTPEQLHDTWCKGKVDDGWTYGPVKDAVAKTHPCLVPYDQLDAGQRTKDAVYLAVASTLLREAA